MNTQILTKSCSKCKIEKPVSEFCKNKRNKDGLHPWCKACRKEYREVNKAAISEYHNKYKKVNKEAIYEYQNKYREANKDILSVRMKEYREVNKNELLVKGRKYREINKDERLIYMKEYRQSDVGKAANKKANHKYRALKFNTTVENFSPIEIFERDGYRCQLCGKKTRPDYKPNHPLYPHLDHIQPISLGGEHSRKNTQCLCHHCNLSKSNTGILDQLRMFG